MVMKGLKMSEEHKKKISEARKREYRDGTRVNPAYFKGKTHTVEARKKISAGNKGKTISKEIREKISKATKGENNPFYGKTHSKETRKILSQKNKERYKTKKDNPWFGRKHTEESKRKMSESSKGILSPVFGKHLSEEHRKKISEARKLLPRRFGPEANNWKGGISSLVENIRKLLEAKEWRKAVFKNDNYTCQECGQIGGQLEAHHIIRFSILFKKFIKEYSQFSPIEDKETLTRLATRYKLFWEKSNGITLCEDCHKLTSNYGKKK